MPQSESKTHIITRAGVGCGTDVSADHIAVTSCCVGEVETCLKQCESIIPEVSLVSYFLQEFERPLFTTAAAWWKKSGVKFLEQQ